MRKIILFLFLTTLTYAKAKDDARIFGCHCDERNWNKDKILITHTFTKRENCTYKDKFGNLGPLATIDWQKVEIQGMTWRVDYRWYCGGNDIPKDQHCLHSMCTTTEIIK